MKKIISSIFLRVSSLSTLILRVFSPESSHFLALNGLKLIDSLGINIVSQKSTKESYELLDLKFKNRLGIAGGLDKSGDYIKPLTNLGVSFLELGTVTPNPQKGNPKPRLYRDIKNFSLINRMGFNNKGVEYLVSKIKKLEIDCHLAVSIGKNSDTPYEKTIDDYVFCMDKAYPVANLITVNISSPNTLNLRTLQSPKNLSELISVLKERQFELSRKYGYKPLLVKISPDENKSNLEEISKILITKEVDGLIATNTTVFDSNNVEVKGGISGSLLLKKSTHVLSTMRKLLGREFPIIASGGVIDVKTYKEKIENGANLVQIYTGLIFKGPRLIQEIIDIQE